MNKPQKTFLKTVIILLVSFITYFSILLTLELVLNVRDIFWWGCLAILPLTPVIRIMIRKSYYKWLYNDLDAKKFKESITNKRIVPSEKLLLDSAIYNGEYQTVISYCTKELKNEVLRPITKFS